MNHLIISKKEGAAAHMTALGRNNNNSVKSTPSIISVNQLLNIVKKIAMEDSDMKKHEVMGIRSQMNGQIENRMETLKDPFSEDVKMVVKDGKIFYLPA